jgi:mannose-6-phosphate isomerase-like protein (cupin superfamily)
MPVRLFAVLSLASLAFAQSPKQTVVWAPKPVKLAAYRPPHKPVTRIADLKAKHQGSASWREVVVDDELLHGEYISSPPGTKVGRRMHPDTREWWAILEGQIRFEIEGLEPFVATRGSMVQVPMQTIYSMETIGDTPSLRFETNIAKAKTIYPVDVEPPELPGFEFMKVAMARTPSVYDRGNRPHVNLYEAAKEPKYHGAPFVVDDRAAANIIYGYAKDMPPLDEKARGHYHPESAEFWVIMTGHIRYPIEGQGVVIAGEGDVVYVPPFTFHNPRYWGDGPSCRLAMNGYPKIAHLFEIRQPH